MKNNYNFPLKHTALYAKGHYERSEDIIEDLKKTIEADGFMPFNKNDIKQLLLNAYEKIPFNGYSQLQNIVDGIAPENVWKVGYYTKQGVRWLFIKDDERETLPDYDYEMAIIMFMISYLRMCDLKDLNGLTLPDKNVLPLKKQENEKD